MVEKNGSPFLLISGLLLMLLAWSSCTSGEEPPVRALLITGGGWHAYEAQAGLLTEGIRARVGEVAIEWTIIREGGGEPDHHASLLREEHRAHDFDALVHNTGLRRGPVSG